MVSNRKQAARKWYRLDNAANVYPAVRDRKRSGMFRLSAVLKEPIQPDLLQQALNNTLQRIPSFAVKMRSGLFWHYFAHSGDTLQVQRDVINPCKKLASTENEGFLIRVRRHDRRIALEVFHSVSDGAGAMVFLKTLVAQYLSQLGCIIPPSHGVLDCEESAQPGEAQDSFQSFARGSPVRSRREPRAFHISGSTLPPYYLNMITGTLPLNAVRAETKKYGVSITEYLTAVFIYILDDIQRAQKPRRLLPVKIQVPVNLRRFHDTQSLRNFSSFVIPGIDPAHGSYSFEEILKSVHHYLRYEVTDKHLRSRVAANIRTERSLLIRMMPLFIKNRMINLGYKYSGPVSFSSTLSNFGEIQVPPEMAAQVEMFDCILCASQDMKIKCGVLGYSGSLRVNFSSVIEETYVEQAFFSFLVEHGIPVAVESNRE